MAQIAKFRKERGKEEVVISGSESDNDSLSEDEMVADDIKVGAKPDPYVLWCRLDPEELKIRICQKKIRS